MNGMGFNTTVQEVRGWWQDAIVLAQLVFGVLTALFLTISIISSVNAKKKAKIAA